MNKKQEKLFYIFSSLGFSLLNVYLVMNNHTFAGIGFGIVAFILGIKALRIKL